MSTATFSLTSPETSLVNQIFSTFDSQKLGVLTGEVAVKAFSGANLPPTVLREIWNIADEENKGWLSRRGVSIAVRLLGWAQKGEKVSKDLLGRPGPLPTIEGFNIVTKQHSGFSLPKSPPPASLPPLTPQDRAKFHNIFYQANPQNGLITGEKARELFLKSKLSNDQLLQIWNLADTQDRGTLDITDFTIGMYFIQAVMSRQLSVIPMSLPPGLRQQAGGNPQHTGSHLSSSSGSLSPVSSTFQQQKSAVPQQYTGQNTLQQNYTGVSSPHKVPPTVPARPTGLALFGASPFPPPNTVQWDVTAAEKATADLFFDELDLNKHGYIEGEVAVPFMLKSNLPGEDLACVWDLADLDNNGRLTRDGFAIAMHLIQKRLTGQDLPAVLPPTLIPPSVRNNLTANAAPLSPVSQQRPPEPVNDLFSFDETPSAPAQITEGPNTLQQQGTGQRLPTFLPPRVSRPAVSDPFSPSATQHHDLLDDDDDDGKASSPLQDKSAEIGNAQNQLNSTNRSLDTLKNERVPVEQLLAEQAAQLATLQTQISSSKAAYDAESKLFANLKERQTNQFNEIQKLREELIHAESNLSAVRVEKAEIEGVFLRDKEEARELHGKMVAVGQEADRLRQELEKVKKEAKQQKGLLAIAKKQLNAKEVEKAKVEKELEEATNEVTSITAEREEAEAELAKSFLAPPPMASPERGVSPDSVTFAAQHPLPSTPEIQSIGQGRSNNPFDRPAAEPNGVTSSTIALSFANAFTIEEGTDQNVTEAAQDTTLAHGAVGSDTNTNTPKPQPISLELMSPESEDFLSPSLENELFVTPPTSSPPVPSPIPLSPPAAEHSIVRAAQQKSPATGDTKLGQPLEATEAQFPAIDVFGAQFPSVDTPGVSEGQQRKPRKGLTETDLSAQLKELDADESDSDSDELPLAELAKDGTRANTGPSLPDIKPSGTTFDDIFCAEITESTQEVTQPRGEPDSRPTLGNSGSPLANIFEAFSVGAQGNTATPANNTGISAFDEALGKIPTGSGADASNAATDSFDVAFDDNFDFPSAGTSLVVAPLAVPAPSIPLTTGVNGSVTVANTDDGFNLFSTPQQAQATAAGVENKSNSGPLSDVAKPTPFDDIFSGLDSRPSLDTENAPSSTNTQPEPATDAESTFKPSTPASPQDKSPPPASNGSPATSLRSSSPAQQKAKSPKRVPSPKPRSSTSSGKEEKQGLPVRHSKLSLRIFGKRKKQQQEVQQPPQHSPPPLVTSPVGNDEDVQPVKQLLSMGFSRGQAIDALERNGYDVQRALNALLGAQ